MYIKHDIESHISEDSKTFQAIVVYGPRQVGKSTTIYMIFCGKYKSISLDNSRDRELALNDSKGLLEVYSWPSEIKKGKNSTKPTKNFNILSKYGLEIKPGLIIDTSDKIRPINDKAYSYPIYLLGE